MKKFIFATIFVFLSINYFFSQVGIGTITPANSSVLDVTSTDKGVLIPRVALVDKNTKTPLTGNIPNGTMIFNTVKAGIGAATVFPGVYVWYANEWVIPAMVGKEKAKAVKFNNSSSSTTNFNPATVASPVNIDIFNSIVFNDDSAIFEKIDDYQIRINASGLYLVSANLALKQNPAVNNSLLYDYIHFNLNGTLASANISTLVTQNNPTNVNVDGRFVFESTSYIYATAGQVLTLQSTRGQDGTNYNGIVSFDTVSLSSVTIIKLQ